MRLHDRFNGGAAWSSRGLTRTVHQSLRVCDSKIGWERLWGDGKGEIWKWKDAFRLHTNTHVHHVSLINCNSSITTTMIYLTVQKDINRQEQKKCFGNISSSEAHTCCYAKNSSQTSHGWLFAFNQLKFVYCLCMAVYAGGEIKLHSRIE